MPYSYDIVDARAGFIPALGFVMPALGFDISNDMMVVMSISVDSSNFLESSHLTGHYRKDTQSTFLVSRA